MVEWKNGKCRSHWEMNCRICLSEQIQQQQDQEARAQRLEALLARGVVALEALVEERRLAQALRCTVESFHAQAAALQFTPRDVEPAAGDEIDKLKTALTEERRVVAALRCTVENLYAQAAALAAGDEP